MIYQISKAIGEMAAVLCGEVDGIVLTGGLLRFDDVLEGIRRRILEQSRAVRPLPEPVPKNKHYRLSGNWQSRKRVTGFRALYFHYCYLLGVFPRQKTQNRKRLHFLLREDLIKLDAITQEARLLAEHRIDTAQQLSSYQSELERVICMRPASNQPVKFWTLPVKMRRWTLPLSLRRFSEN